MTSLTLSNLDEATVKALQNRASTHGRTLEEVAEALLSQAVQAPFSPEERLERARRIRAMTPKDVVQPDSTELIREDRDSR